MSYSVIRPANHDEWLEARKGGIGSSDAGTIMGASPFSTPLKLWRQKMGLEPPVQENRAMRFGHVFEPAVAEFFASETGATIDYSSEGDWIAVDDDKPFLRVSPDRLFWPEGVEQTSDNWRILEIKTTRKAVDKNNPPLYWFCQVQYQMGVMGIKHAVIAYLTSEPYLDADWIEVEFNQTFYNTLIALIEDFWNNNILGGVEPPEKNADDVIIKYPAHVEGKKIIADDVTIKQCLELHRLKALKNGTEEEISRLEGELKMLLKDAEAIEFPHPKTGEPTAAVTFRATSVNVLDEEKLKQEMPELYGRFLVSSFDSKKFTEETKQMKGLDKYYNKEKGSRRFSLKPSVKLLEENLDCE